MVPSISAWKQSNAQVSHTKESNMNPFNYMGRMQRLPFFGWGLTFIFGNAFVNVMSKDITISPQEAAGLYIFVTVLWLGILSAVIQRHRDIGWRWWTIIFAFIPFIGWAWVFTPTDAGRRFKGAKFIVLPL
jgi:uncharacterized membrane protein YhaH (DUF805 family)